MHTHTFTHTHARAHTQASTVTWAHGVASQATSGLLGGNSSASCDPFARLRVNQAVQRSATLKGTLAPAWDETMIFYTGPVMSCMYVCMYVCIFHFCRSAHICSICFWVSFCAGWCKLAYYAETQIHTICLGCCTSTHTARYIDVLCRSVMLWYSQLICVEFSRETQTKYRYIYVICRNVRLWYFWCTNFFWFL
jgi:hypothetical protein